MAPRGTARASAVALHRGRPTPVSPLGVIPEPSVPQSHRDTGVTQPPTIASPPTPHPPRFNERQALCAAQVGASNRRPHPPQAMLYKDYEISYRKDVDLAKKKARGCA